MAHTNFLFTSESVSEGHPDKVCDQISDAVLDAFLENDIKLGIADDSLVNTRLGCETLTTTNKIVIAAGTEGLKEAVKNMPGIPTYGYIGFVGWDEYYWTNWPGSENAYNEPYTHWPNFKYTTPFLKPTGA